MYGKWFGKITIYNNFSFENNNVHEQTLDASTFDIMNVTEYYCKIGSEM